MSAHKPLLSVRSSRQGGLKGSMKASTAMSTSQQARHRQAFHAMDHLKIFHPAGRSVHQGAEGSHTISIRSPAHPNTSLQDRVVEIPRTLSFAPARLAVTVPHWHPQLLVMCSGAHGGDGARRSLLICLHSCRPRSARCWLALPTSHQKCAGPSYFIHQKLASSPH